MRETFKRLITRILTWEAKTLLERKKPYIIAVTGSVGKTSAKDAIALALHKSVRLLKSEKSFNSEIGIPLTVLGLPNAWYSAIGWGTNILRGLHRAYAGGEYPEVLVLEVGVDRPGDIDRFTSWITPNMAVLTRLPERPVHMENFPTPEGVREEKSKLAHALPENGMFVGNADDEAIRTLAGRIKAKNILYGFSEHAQLRGHEPEADYGEDANGTEIFGMRMTVEYDGSRVPVKIENVIGRPACYAILAALAVGVARGLPIEEVAANVSALEPPKGRMRIIRGREGSTIIDDSYNSSPVAAFEALDTLRILRGKRKIAILGDMLELGVYSEEEHRKIGRTCGAFLDTLAVVGKRAKLIAEEAKKAGMKGELRSFPDAIGAGKWVAGILRAGDVVLVKGSQGSGENTIRLERAVRELMEEPGKAPELLVRQEKEWTKTGVQGATPEPRKKEGDRPASIFD